MYVFMALKKVWKKCKGVEFFKNNYMYILIGNEGKLIEVARS